MRVRILNFELALYFNILESRTGVCSGKADGSDRHMLLFDFDNANLASIAKSLEKLQATYKLPNIYIVQSSPLNYHGYCFSNRSFRETIMLLSSVPEIDEKYLRLGIVRGYYTLRISQRAGEIFKTVLTLESMFPREMETGEMTVNEYLTSNKGGRNA